MSADAACTHGWGLEGSEALRMTPEALQSEAYTSEIAYTIMKYGEVTPELPMQPRKPPSQLNLEVARGCTDVHVRLLLSRLTASSCEAKLWEQSSRQ